MTTFQVRQDKLNNTQNYKSQFQDSETALSVISQSFTSNQLRINTPGSTQQLNDFFGSQKLSSTPTADETKYSSPFGSLYHHTAELLCDIRTKLQILKTVDPHTTHEKVQDYNSRFPMRKKESQSERQFVPPLPADKAQPEEIEVTLQTKESDDIKLLSEDQKERFQQNMRCFTSSDIISPNRLEAKKEREDKESKFSDVQMICKLESESTSACNKENTDTPAQYSNTTSASHQEMNIHEGVPDDLEEFLQLECLHKDNLDPDVTVKEIFNTLLKVGNNEPGAHTLNPTNENAQLILRELNQNEKTDLGTTTRSNHSSPFRFEKVTPREGKIISQEKTKILEESDKLNKENFQEAYKKDSPQIKIEQITQSDSKTQQNDLQKSNKPTDILVKNPQNLVVLDPNIRPDTNKQKNTIENVVSSSKNPGNGPKRSSKKPERVKVSSITIMDKENKDSFCERAEKPIYTIVQAPKIRKVNISLEHNQSFGSIGDSSPKNADVLKQSKNEILNESFKGSFGLPQQGNSAQSSHQKGKGIKCSTTKQKELSMIQEKSYRSQARNEKNSMTIKENSANLSLDKKLKGRGSNKKSLTLLSSYGLAKADQTPPLFDSHELCQFDVRVKLESNPLDKALAKIISTRQRSQKNRELSKSQITQNSKVSKPFHVSRKSSDE